MATRLSHIALRLAAAGVPMSLLWDYAWESTIGIDQVWSPPHVATHIAIGLAATCALRIAWVERSSRAIGAWVVLWGAVAFVTAQLLDGWWQSNYGLSAGLWHPPQLLKAVAFFAVAVGAWLAAGGGALAGGSVLALIHVVSLPWTFANRQHDATFFLLACVSYPAVLVACSLAARQRFAATAAAAAYMLLVSVLVWMLPLFEASPLTGPIFHPRDHLLPPPFPLLLLAPALALDWLLRVRPGTSHRYDEIGRAAESALAFCLVFIAVQWLFAGFLLSPAADNRFFAGGGKHWPFFLEIPPGERTAFWLSETSGFTMGRVVIAALLALLSSHLGLWVGGYLHAIRR